MMSGEKDKRERIKSSAEKKRKKNKARRVDQSRDKEENYDKSKKKKERNNQVAEHETIAANKVYGPGAKVANKTLGNERRKLRKKEKKNVKKAGMNTFDNEAVEYTEQQNFSETQVGNDSLEDHTDTDTGTNMETSGSTLSETQVENEIHEGHTETLSDTRTNLKSSKSKNTRQKKKKQRTLSREDKNQSENRNSIEDDIYQISSGDEDCSKGMKKWIMEYHQSRPGLNVLQERIDDFITEYEARVEQERKEREAQAAEDGWTVVVHHKGRKKTTDTESGVVVGSVAQATVLDKMTKKKDKQGGLDFYRFQKREAQRSELMMLQSKFEQDKKRIQQMRAARKFRPY